MKSWFPEDTHFDITVLQVRPDGRCEGRCRAGHEPGDRYTCGYGCPEGLCSKSMLKLFPLMEAARSRGDFRNLGGSERCEMELDCPDGVVRFRIRALFAEEKKEQPSPGNLPLRE